VLVLGRFDLGVRPTVDAELLVGNQIFFFGQVLVHLRPFGPKERVIGKNAGPLIVLPVEW
jgi:hypothetical protein